MIQFFSDDQHFSSENLAKTYWKRRPLPYLVQRKNSLSAIFVILFMRNSFLVEIERGTQRLRKEEREKVCVERGEREERERERERERETGHALKGELIADGSSLSNKLCFLSVSNSLSLCLYLRLFIFSLNKCVFFLRYLT